MNVGKGMAPDRIEDESRLVTHWWIPAAATAHGAGFVAVAFSRRWVAVKALPSSAADSHRYEDAAQSLAIPSGSDSSAPIPLPVLLVATLLLWVLSVFPGCSFIE